MRSNRIAGAPLSYGAFELTVGRLPNVPGAEQLLGEVHAAGYDGIELGPPGYLGAAHDLRDRLERFGLDLSGGWIQCRFSAPEHWVEDFAVMRTTLELFAAAGATHARPVLGDGGSDARRANVGRGSEDKALGLSDQGWRTFADGVARAAELARSFGFEPAFHPHACTYVEGTWEIERFLELSDIGLVVDTGHLLIGGTDPAQALRDWGTRVAYVHVKDVRLDILREVIAERAEMFEAWRRGIFCELGAGNVDLGGFFAELDRTEYAGWIVVEQDCIPRPDQPLVEAAAAQVRNREWLRENVGV